MAMNFHQSAIKTRFAVRFVQAMKRLNKRRGVTTTDSYKRYRATRAAACASMASAVGPQRAWSRAVLSKTKRRRFQAISRKRRLINPRRNLGFGQEEDLRGLVPGGKGMEYCSLLSETAHYIRCLQAQIQVMTDILHHSSSLN
ncbi:transcription factor IBH1-like [Salvia divinorum]|uniref:Transcription factor IBH1-like n=1 Tax=Salvia divinorum TaxID=28513 RepID=A0ABD1H8V3_SALDI